MLKLTKEEQIIGGLLIGALGGSLLLSNKQSIIIPFVKLPYSPRRFIGDPEVEVEIAGKRTHMRIDTGNAGPLMLLKSTSDYLEIKKKFHPLHPPMLDPFQNFATA